MTARKTTTKLLVMLLTSGLWLAGCGEATDPSPDQDPSENRQEEGATAQDSDDEASDPQDSQDDSNPDGTTSNPALAADATWSGARGPAGGTFTSLWAADGSFFATQTDARGDSFLWRSDAGDAWTRVDLPDDLIASQIVNVVAHEGDLILVGPKPLRSSDGGETWQPFDWQLENGAALDARELTAARVFDGELFVVAGAFGQTSTLYRVSGGEAKLVDDTLPTRTVDIAMVGQTMVLSQGHYAGRLFFKNAQTSDWTPAQTPADQNPADQTAASNIVGGKQLHVDAGSIYATSEAGVWRTIDGASFHVVTNQPAREAVIHGDSLLFGPLEPWNYVMSIELSDAAGGEAAVEYLSGMNEAESFLLASDGSEVISSVRDHGLHRLDFATEEWEQISPTLRPVADFANAGGSYWLLTVAGRLFQSPDAQNWQPQPIGEHRGAKLLAQDDAVFVVTKAGDFVALRPGYNGWTMGEPVALSEGTVSSVVGYDDSLLVSFAPRILSGRGGSTPVGGGLYLAENHAEHWSDWNRIGEELPEDYDHQQTPPVYAAHAEDGLLVVIAKDGLYRSVDGGESWARASLDAPFDASYLHAERAWLARGEQGLFALTMTASGMHLRRSDDGGESWSTVVRSPDGAVTPSALVADGPNLLLGTWEEGVLVSTDGGQSWHTLADGLVDAPVRDLHLRGSTLWAATTDGVMSLE